MSQLLFNDFDLNFPENIRDFFHHISKEGFHLTLVGGIVRDFLLKKEIGRDLDFELRYSSGISEKEWEEKVSSLGRTLKKKYQYQVEELPFSILRVSIDGYDIEMSSPRLEKYNEQDFYKHSDFVAELSSNLNYEDSFKRRDFSLNAMAIEFKEEEGQKEFRFIDPFKGKIALDKGLLTHCSDDFVKDPVRFLRMIRFSLKFDLEIDEKLMRELSLFDLRGVNAHYFFSEAFKYNFLEFSAKFFSLVEDYQIRLPKNLKGMSFLKDLSEKRELLNKEDVFFFLAVKGVDSHHLESFADYAQIKKNLLGTIQNILECLEVFKERSLRELVDRGLKNEFDSGEVPDELTAFNIVYGRRDLLLKLIPFLSKEDSKKINEALEFLPSKIDFSSEAEKALSSTKSAEWKKHALIYFFLKNS